MFLAFRGGVHDLRLASHLFSVTIVVVALSTFVLLAAPMLEQVEAVEEFGVNRRSWVVVHVDPASTRPESSSIAEDLLKLAGVDEVTGSTKREVELVVATEPVPDLENYLTMGLDGSESPDYLAREALAVPGVESSYPKSAQAPESNRAFYEEILPLVTLLTAGVGLILVVRLAFLAARTKRRKESGLLVSWIRHGAVVVLPVFLTMVGASLVAGLLWFPVVSPMVSSLAQELITGNAILEVGLQYAFYALLVVTMLTFIAMASERPGKHTP